MRMSSRSRRVKVRSKAAVRRRKKIVRRAGFVVYILCCADGTFYTGYTKDLKARLKLHNAGRGSKYVRARRPASLVYSRPYRYYKFAIREEARIKTLTRKAKEKLIKQC